METIPYLEVIVVAADDNHSLNDDYPLQPNLSRQVVAQEVPRGSAYDVGWVYHRLWDNDVDTRLSVLSIYQQMGGM